MDFLKNKRKIFRTFGLDLIFERHSSELISDKFSGMVLAYFCVERLHLP